VPEHGDKVLKFPYRGAPQTIEVMRHSALTSQGSMIVRQLAESICQGIDSKDYASEYLAIYYYVLQRCRYMRDPRTVELVRAPYVIAQQLLDGQRPCLDCDDMAALIAALCLAIGGQVELVTVAFKRMHFNGQQQYSHVYCRALDPRTRLWITLDPVAAEKTNEMIGRIVAMKTWTIA